MARSPHSKNRSPVLRDNSATARLFEVIADAALGLGAMMLVMATPRVGTARDIERALYRAVREAPTLRDILASREAPKKSFPPHTAFLRLQKQGLLSVQRKGNNKIAIVVSKKGWELYHKKKLNTIVIPIPKQWDKHWRIILFDIPEHYREGRDVLRAQLQRLGFWQMQKSAFVHPYPCHQEIEKIVHHFELEPFVVLIETSDLAGREREARNFFGLP